jgi:bifunctional pyridoxal-dependent enzyme with beta-cystathionase and maltose regulon repressor activities
MQDPSNIVKDKEAISVVIANKHEDNSLDFNCNTARLQRIIALCKKYDVAVVLLEMPVYPAYYNLLDTKKKEKIKSVLGELSSVEDTVFYLDLTTDPLFEKQDLRDADHLTNQGAKKCSEYLNTYLKDVVHFKIGK